MDCGGCFCGNLYSAYGQILFGGQGKGIIIHLMPGNGIFFRNGSGHKLLPGAFSGKPALLRPVLSVSIFGVVFV